MVKNDTYKLFLRDLVYILKERQVELESECEKDNFDKGVAFNNSSVIELIESQADAFQIELSDFGFNDFEKYTNKQ